MKKVKGTELSKAEQQKALAKFVHRFTGDHYPQWANVGRRDGRLLYPLQFKNDNDWLEHTYFWVRNDGKLSEKHRYCDSHPTWPNGLGDANVRVGVIKQDRAIKTMPLPVKQETTDVDELVDHVNRELDREERSEKDK